MVSRNRRCQIQNIGITGDVVVNQQTVGCRQNCRWQRWQLPHCQSRLFQYLLCFVLHAEGVHCGAWREASAPH